MNTTFKIVNVNTARTVRRNLEWQEAMYILNNHPELCVMEMWADVADRLARREKLIDMMAEDEA